MIYDKLEHLGQYAKLAPEAIGKIVEFCKECGCAPEIGRYEIDGTKIYAMVQSYATHAADPEKLEYHRKYADIQLLLTGGETLIYAPCGNECVPYNPEKDCGFDRLPETGAVALPLEVGNFALLLPGEGHLPGVGKPDNAVVKVVVKIAAELLNGNAI